MCSHWCENGEIEVVVVLWHVMLRNVMTQFDSSTEYACEEFLSFQGEVEGKGQKLEFGKIENWS
jgi:molybdopterin-guanine dinucleotide biosynthesis protein A